MYAQVICLNCWVSLCLPGEAAIALRSSPKLEQTLQEMLPPGRAIFLRRLKAKITKAQDRAQRRTAKEDERRG